MINVTISRLSAKHYPWCWALRIRGGDSAPFRELLDTIKREVGPRRCKWDADNRRWLLRDGEQETVCAVLRFFRIKAVIEDERRAIPAVGRYAIAATLPGYKLVGGKSCVRAFAPA